MPKIPAINPLLQAWLLEGPLSAQVPAYVARLRRGRYATHTSGRCLNGVEHVCRQVAHRHPMREVRDAVQATARGVGRIPAAP